MDTVKRYLKQPSTWHGINIIAGVLGYVIAPGTIEALCVGIAGLIEALRDGDKK